MSKKPPPTQPVRYAFPIHFEPGHTASKLTIRPDGTLLITDKDGNPVAPISAGRRTSYERRKGPKIQTQNIGLPGFVSISGLIELTEYDKIILSDANTRTVAGESITACCCFEGRFIRASETSVRFELTDPHLRILEMRGGILEPRGAPGNPEMLAILRITSEIAAHQKLTRAAVITDSELGRHEAINARTEPLFGDQHLPEPFRLIYASTDTGADAPNKLLRLCEKESSNHLDRLEAGDSTEVELFKLEGQQHVLYRFLRYQFEVEATFNFPTIGPDTTISIYGLPKPT